jgi:glycosyltransferase involved in cell wall biosynthesis
MSNESQHIHKGKKKIAFVISSLGLGGAERNLVQVVNNLDRSRYDCYVVCLTAKGSNNQLLNKDGITVIDLEYPRIYFSILPVKKAIKKIQPDIIVGWMGYLNAYLAFFIPSFPKHIRWVCRESSIPSAMNKQYKFPWLYDLLYKYYNRYDKIICQSQFMADDLVNSFKVKEEKIRLISNGVDFPAVEKNQQSTGIDTAFDKEHHHLLYVGGLRAEKRVDLAIDALALLPGKYHLTILGDGELYDQLSAHISKKGLGTRVRIIRGCYNPYPYYTGAKCLLICSLFEGFPNVVVEAFACGCPVIGYNITGGAQEVLQHYGGRMVRSEAISSFSQAIIDLCENEEPDRIRIIEECKKKYDIRSIIQQYDAVFDGIEIQEKP